jgi:P27 family predicted phage terminase small subunit
MSPKPALPAIPKAPKALGKAGRRYWKTVCSTFEIEPHHFELLEKACVQLDRAEQAREVVEREGVTAQDRFGQAKTHPAVEVERQAHLAFRLLCRELGMDVQPVESRSYRRTGTRD